MSDYVMRGGEQGKARADYEPTTGRQYDAYD